MTDFGSHFERCDLESLGLRRDNPVYRGGVGLARSSDVRRDLRQLEMNCSCFLMNESHSVSNYEVEVSQVHSLASVIKSENMCDRYPRTCWRYLFVRTLNMPKIVRNDVHQFEL